jgi:hypothetical protein
MSFSYDDTMTADVDKVRFGLQDTELSKGPKPGNANFTNDEIDALLSMENSWQLAVAAGFEKLAAAWARHTSFSVVNGSFTRSDAAKQYLAMAKEWREKYGESITSYGRPGSIAVVKVDYGIDTD